MTAVQQVPTAGPPATPAGAPAGTPPAPASSGRLRWTRPASPPSGPARLLPRTVAGRLRTLTTVVVVVLLALVGVAWAAIANARDGVQVIGHDAGPQVVATGNLYFYLSDMDAQLANALLIGGAPGGGRDKPLAQYDDDRRKAGQALLQASKLADEGTEETTARNLLEALGRYERLAGQALLEDQRSGHVSGPPPAQVIKLYQQATDLMKLDLLPKAYNLTLDNGTLVRHTYEDKRSAVLTGRTWVLVTGLALLCALVGLQFFLAVRFRRLLNLPLALAGLGVLVLVTVTTITLTGQANHLRKAKQDGFDSILALSRARAISNSANADETRFLLDASRADAYEQVFLSKSQTVLYLPAGNLAKYNQAVQQNAKVDGPHATFLGFLGTEAAGPALPGQRAALGKALEEYRSFQQSDRRVRDLYNGGGRAQAVAARGDSATAFTGYDKAMLALVGIHQTAFDKAVADGDKGTSGWYAVLPIAGVVIAALVLLGVRPRLAEYRFSK